MTVTRQLFDLPNRMKGLPVDHRGFPVPKFVAQIDGEWDFRVIAPGWISQCYRHRKCWLCGDKLGRFMAFVIGPMCAVNRINSEPPSHYECAKFAARNCPFLTRPLAKRRDDDLPEGSMSAPGLPLDRNPGVAAIWVCESYKPMTAGRGNQGTLFSLGDPNRVEFWCQGRKATKEEVLNSVNSGLPLLRNAAIQDGPNSVRELQNYIERFERLIDREMAA